MTEARRPVDELLVDLDQALATNTFVKLTLGKPRRGAAEDPSAPAQAFVRLVEIKHAPHISVLLRYPTKDITENHPVADAAVVIGALLADRFTNAHLFTTQHDVELRANNKGEARLFRSKATFSTPPSAQHDRVRRYVLDPAKAPYLRELGIVGGEGKVRSAKADKYRQLQSIVKILDELVHKSDLRTKPHLHVVDMGCGKGYLTFALYDYCNNELGIKTDVLGVDRNTELVGVCNAAAQKLGYAGLKFEASSVETIELDRADIVVALHACDTATDVALFKAVAAHASIVMAVPCCQHELRAQFVVPVDERALLKHDTFKDRYSQMVTDALRGLLLESQGYRTRVTEFISDAHTHRNVMITGVHDPAIGERDHKRAEAVVLMRRYGIEQQQLQHLLVAAGLLTPG